MKGIDTNVLVRYLAQDDEAQFCQVLQMLNRKREVFFVCDLVLVEGDTQTSAPRLEVWRAALGTPPLAESDPSIRALISDDPLEIAIPIWPRSDMDQLVAYILELAGIGVR